MGRQAYITRLALGRSPFEDLRVLPTAEEIRSADVEATAATESGTYIPSSKGYVQRYDCRGHPQNLASDILREQSRRAQNSVSSTLGDYLHNIGRRCENGNEKLPIDPAKIKAVRRENNIGMLVLTVDQCLFFSTHICLVGVRQRLQTFNLYAGASLWEVLKFERIHFGLKKMLFAGFLASCLNRTGNSISVVAIEFCDYLAERVFKFFRLRKHGEHVAGLTATSNQILQGIVFILLTPLKFHAIRQTLDLVAMRPFLPAPTAFIPFTYQSLLQSLRLSAPLSFDSCPQDIKALLLSPVVLWCILSYCKRHAHYTIHYYLRFIFPRPDNPDIYSLKGAKRGGYDLSYIFGLDTTNGGQLSLISMVKRDFMASVQIFQSHLEQLRNVWQRRELRVRSKSRTELVDEPPQLVDTGQVDTATESVRAGTPHSSRSVPTNTTTSHHRVTVLSGSPAALILRHLAWNLTDLLFVPVESYLLRSIAHNYLSSPQAPSSASRIQSPYQILPLGSWFGVGLRAGGWRGVVSYAGKIGLWWGIEVAVGFVIWQLHAGVVWWYAPWAKTRDKSNRDRYRNRST